MILDDRESCIKFNKKCDINDHWKPFSLKCSFCEINYRVIGKIEAFERDRKFKKSYGEIFNLNSVKIVSKSIQILSNEYFNQREQTF